MSLKSLDPRVGRLHILEQEDNLETPKGVLDQFETYEAFVQVKEGKSLDHVGPVHAPNEEMAFLFAKEQFTRRGSFCNALCIVKTENILMSEYSDNKISVYDAVVTNPTGIITEEFEIFHLFKRGKQHRYIGTVNALNFDDALANSKVFYPSEKPVYNVWVVNSKDILTSDDDDRDIWDTLKEKQNREAIDYKGQDLIKAYKEKIAQD